MVTPDTFKETSIKAGVGVKMDGQNKANDLSSLLRQRSLVKWASHPRIVVFTFDRLFSSSIEITTGK